MRALLAAPGIDVNKANNIGWTAVIMAASRGHVEVVRALVAAPGIDVNKANNDGWTAVMKASVYGHTEVMKALLAAPGIDINKADNTGWTAVMHAAREGRTEVIGVVKALLAAPGIDVNKRATGLSWNGYTALGIAIALKCRCSEIETLLRAAGAEGEHSAAKGGAAPAPAAAKTSTVAAAAFAQEDALRAYIARLEEEKSALGEQLEQQCKQNARLEKEGSAAVATLRAQIARLEKEKSAQEAADTQRKEREAPEGTGQRIYDAAKEGDMAALRPLVQEWSGHDDVLNWATPDDFGLQEQVQRLVETIGETRCRPDSLTAFSLNHLYSPVPSLSPPRPLASVLKRRRRRQGGDQRRHGRRNCGGRAPTMGVEGLG